jgi:hypothetical protein
LIPHPNLRGLTANIKDWTKAGIKGYFGDGIGNGTGGTEMADLRAWLIAKLLWDPSQDPDALVEEFTDGFFGEAGKHVRAYLDVMHNAVEASGDWLDLSSPPDAPFLSLETLVAGWTQLELAEAVVKDDPAFLARVKVAQLPVLFVFLARWDRLHDDAVCRGIAWPFPGRWEEVHGKFQQIVKLGGVTPSGQTLALLAKKGK